MNIVTKEPKKLLRLCIRNKWLLTHQFFAFLSVEQVLGFLPFDVSDAAIVQNTNRRQFVDDIGTVMRLVCQWISHKTRTMSIRQGINLRVVENPDPTSDTPVSSILTAARRLRDRSSCCWSEQELLDSGPCRRCPFGSA